MLSDRVIRVYVVDRKGRSIPNAQVKVFVNRKLFTTAAAGTSSAGTVYTVQISDRKAEVGLQAEYASEPPQTVTLAQDADEFRFSFPHVEIPVDRDKPFWEEHLAGIIGVGFLVISIALAILLPSPTPFQNRVFIGALAICLSGIATEFSGFLNLKMTLGRKLAVTAGGALAIFVLVYFFVPA